MGSGADVRALQRVEVTAVISVHDYAEMALRLLVTLLLCGAIGLQRSYAGKAAGVRTHILVGVGSALMTLASAYAFPGWPDGSRDPTRIAAQIVTGIGFIGGGVILKEGLSVRGLTTAASLWAVAGIGIAAGSNLMPLAAIAAALMLLTLDLLGRVEPLIPHQHGIIWTLSLSLSNPDQRLPLHQTLRAKCRALYLIGYESGGADRPALFTFQVTAPRQFDVAEVSQALIAKGATDLRWTASAIGEDLA